MRAVVFLCESLGVISLCIAGLRIVQYVFAQIPVRSWSEDRHVLMAIYAGVNTLRWIAICLLIALLVWAPRRLRGRWGLGDLGFRTSKSWPGDLWTGVVGFGLAYVCSLPILLRVFPAKASHASGMWYKSILDPTYPSLFLLLSWTLSITGNLFSSFWEEIYYRGYFQQFCSRLFTPATAFYATLLFFSFGHLFSRPEWSMLDAVYSAVATVVFAVLFQATGSLIAPTVAHWLANAWWDYPFALHMHRSPQDARDFLLILGAVCAVLCLAGWKEVRSIARSFRQMLAGSLWRPAALGILLGAICLLYLWGVSIVARTIGRWETLAVQAVFGVVALALLHLPALRSRV
jgi:membrane protease YdiL (CAAX protease family)